MAATATNPTGGFLQADIFAETSKNVASPSDAFAAMILGIMWAGSAYAIGMIWTVMALIDRWRGPHGEGKINFVSVVSAVILASAWPVVLIILATSS